MSPNTRAAGSKQGVKELCLVISFAIVLLLTAEAIGWVFGWPMPHALRATFAVSSVCLSVLFVARWLRDRMTRGRLILDCGPIPQLRRLQCLFCAAIIFIALLLLPAAFESLWGASILPLLVLLCLMGTGRVQICERGLWVYTQLIRWSMIESYQWADDSTLLVNTGGVLKSVSRPIPIAREHTQVLAEYLATRHSAEVGTEFRENRERDGWLGS